MAYQHVGIVLKVTVNDVPRQRLFGRPNRIGDQLVVVIGIIGSRLCHLFTNVCIVYLIFVFIICSMNKHKFIHSIHPFHLSIPFIHSIYPFIPNAFSDQKETGAQNHPNCVNRSTRGVQWAAFSALFQSEPNYMMPAS